VRRFDSRKNVRHAQKNGIKFDNDRGSGIPATTTNIEPVNPDKIKDVTGARNADAWMDIEIAGKRVVRRMTKEGRKEIVIQEDVSREDIQNVGRTHRSKQSKEALDEYGE
jgi:hypothetical protein